MDELDITPPGVRFELHAYGETYDVSNSLQDWKEIEVILSRKDTSGVYMEVSFPFKFVLEACDIVAAIFEEYGFRAKADMYIYLRNNGWTYDEPHIFNLDFSTFEQSDTAIEINSRRSNLYEQLKEKETVNFHIPVNEIKETPPFYFDRIEFENKLPVLVAYPNTPWSLSNNQSIRRYPVAEASDGEITVPGIITTRKIEYKTEINGDDYF